MKSRSFHGFGVVTLALAGSALSTPALAQDAEVDARIRALEERIDSLEAQNRRLIELLDNRIALAYMWSLLFCH